VLDTSTSFDPANALTCAPMCTATPADVLAANLALAVPTASKPIAN
jgi:hypothetical protein